MDALAKQAPDRRLLPDHPWLRDLDEKSPQEVARLWTRLFDPRKQPNAQIGEQVEIEVTIDPGAAPGDRDLRLVTPGGLTNPLRFQVGVLPETREEHLLSAGDAPAPAVDLPVLLNGQIMPGEVDRFRLRARTGQQLVIQTRPVGSHKILRCDGAESDGVTVRPLVPHHAHAAHRQQSGERLLRRLAQ